MWVSLGLIVFLVVEMTAEKSSNGCSGNLKFEPQDLNTVRGENISISCTICNQSLRSRYHASNLIFRFEFSNSSLKDEDSEEDDCNYYGSASNEVDLENNYSLCNETGGDSSNCSEELSEYEELCGLSLKVDQSYVQVIGQHKARLTYPGLWNSFNSGSLVCCIDGRDDLCKKTSILVGERPHVPIIGNMTVKNWEKFEFHWMTEKENDIYATIYRAWYRHGSSENFLMCPLVEGKCAMSCVVDFNLRLDHDHSAASRIVFMVNASNVVGKATEEQEVDLYDIVTPDPVHVRVAIGNSSTCVNITSPKFGAELIYEVLFKCFGPPTLLNIPKSNANSLEKCVPDLPSHSDCSVSVRAKPYSYGRWGQWGSKKRFTTPQRVPLASPEVCQSCFEILSTNDDKTTCNVLVFPKPLTRSIARGRVVTYHASLTTNDDRQQSPVTQNFFFNADNSVLNISGLDLTSSYSITVVAATEAGFNESIIVSPLIISPTNARKHGAWLRNITAFIIDSTTINLSWACEHQRPKGFTVFWCRVATLNQCKDPVEWSCLPSNVTRFNITNLPAFDLLNYLFGVAVETADGHSSGVVWTKCLYNLSRVSSPPRINSKVNGMKVRLNFSKNSECNAGFPYAYRIEYCPMPISGTRCHSGSATELIVDDDTYEFSHLASDTKYLFIVSSLSVAGPSLRNSTHELTTPSEDGSNLYIIIVVVVGLMSVLVPLAVYFKRIRDYSNITISPPPVVQSNDYPQSLTVDEYSGFSPDYAHILGELPETSCDIHEKDQVSMNGWSPALDSSSSCHLIPKNFHIAPDPPYRGGRRITENREEDDNESVASNNYAQGKLLDKLDVVPSSPPVTPSFSFNSSAWSFPKRVLDFVCVDNELHHSPEPPPLSAVVVDVVNNSSNSSSCGYAVGHMNDRHGELSGSTADDISFEIPESRNGCSLVPSESLGDSISGSNNDATSNLLDDKCSLSVFGVRSPPEGSRSDDDNSSILSSSNYVLANLKDKDYDLLLNTPAVDVSYPMTDDDNDSDASVSLLNNKLANGSTDSLPRAIPSNSVSTCVHESTLSS